MMRLGVLGSTRGTNLLPIAEAIKQQTLAATLAVVVSNKADALVLHKARDLGIATFFVDDRGKSRETFDAQVSDIFSQHQVDIIVLIGYMRILSAVFVHQWQGRILNIHPSLLPHFAGLMNLQVHQAVLQAGHGETGCTVHWVTEQVDEGPILLQQHCPVFPEDSPETLKARVQGLEGEVLVRALKTLTECHSLGAGLAPASRGETWATQTKRG